MQRAVRVLATSGLVLVMLAAPAFAAKRHAKSESGHVFELESGLVARDPAVAAAMVRLDGDPEGGESWRALGKALVDQGDYTDAVRAFREATTLAPKDVNAWVDLGATYIRIAEPQRAVSALEKALRLEPYMAIAHYNLGLAHQALGRHDDALDDFEYALTIDPSLGDPRQNPSAIVNPDLPYAKLRVFMNTQGRASALYAPPTTTGSPAAAPPQEPHRLPRGGARP